MAVTHGQGNPNWTRDETILALNLLFELNGANPSPTDEKVVKLSALLNQLPIHPYELRKTGFRNPSGVALKIQNLKSVETGRGLTKNSKTDKEIWALYGDKPKEVARLAAEIIADSSLLNENDQVNSIISDDESFSEGKIITITHKTKERDKNLRKDILKIREKENRVYCDICGIKPYFDDTIDKFAIYECHHIVPLSQVSGLVKTRPEDIAFICTNCHNAIHRKIAKEKRWITPDEMKKYIK